MHFHQYHHEATPLSYLLFSWLRIFLSVSSSINSQSDLVPPFQPTLLCPPLMAETVVLRVAMSCQGCAGAVKRVLTNMEGVESFEVDLQEQKVTVKGNVTPDAVFQTVSKSGKKTSFWEGEAKEAETVEPASASPEAAPEPVLEAAPAAATA